MVLKRYEWNSIMYYLVACVCMCVYVCVFVFVCVPELLCHDLQKPCMHFQVDSTPVLPGRNLCLQYMNIKQDIHERTSFAALLQL